jgi:glutathione S-transferase
MIKLYDATPSRSARCVWTLRELEVPFEAIDAAGMRQTEAYRQVHPMGKVPALEIDGRVLIESAAICTYLADLHADKGLITAPGTWERALHDQWVSFALSEMEAYLWSTLKNTLYYPEEKRVPEVRAQNEAEFKRAAAVLDDALGKSGYLTGERFSVTDIIVSFTLNWGRRASLTGGLDAVEGYLDRLYTRPHCTLKPPGA